MRENIEIESQQNKYAIVCNVIINIIYTVLFIILYLFNLETPFVSFVSIGLIWTSCIITFIANKRGKKDVPYYVCFSFLLYYCFAVTMSNNFFLQFLMIPMFLVVIIYNQKLLINVLLGTILAANVFSLISNGIKDNTYLINDIVLIVCVITGIIIFNIVNHLLKMQNKMLKRLDEEANYDALTKIHNRNYLQKLMEKHKVDGTSARSAALIDIDDFKKINDTYGHKYGDFALKKLANTLLKYNKHTNNECIRLGGDEFVIISNDMGTQQIRNVAEAVRIHINDDPVMYGKEAIMLSLSIGVTSMSIEDGFNIAYDTMDKALYQAKKNGKNNTVVIK